MGMESMWLGRQSLENSRRAREKAEELAALHKSNEEKKKKREESMPPINMAENLNIEPGNPAEFGKNQGSKNFPGFPEAPDFSGR